MATFDNTFKLMRCLHSTDLQSDFPSKAAQTITLLQMCWCGFSDFFCTNTVCTLFIYKHCVPRI